jgi:hypothetical protein
MARLAAYQDGNFTGATTWKTIDTTSYLMSSAGTTATTTSFVGSANFTPGAITVEGIGLFISNRVASPSGTMEVQLWNATGSVQVALVTVNVADLPAPPTGTTINAHVFFEFAASVVLLAATNYQVRVRTSVAGTVTLFTNATAGNWSRYLRTSTIATAAATDDFFVCGELTAAGANTPITVTMNNNNTNQYGFCAVGHLGTLDWATASNTELRLGTDVLGSTQGVTLYVSGGTANVGTSAARIAAGVTATLRFNSTGVTTTTMNGIHVTGSGTFRAYGQRRTNNWVALTANAPVGETQLTVASGHGFVTGDDIGIAPTARTTTEFERRTLIATTATTLRFATGLASAKSGTAPTQAEIINLTRNVSIRGNTTAQTTFINAQTGAIIDCDSVMFEFAGGGRQTIFSAAGVQGATRGSCDVKHCAFKDTGTAGTYFATSTVNPTATNITNNVFYNHLTNGISFAATAPTAGSNCSVNDNILIGGTNTAISVFNPDVTISGNRVSGVATGFGIVFGQLAATVNINTAPLTNNIIHTCQNGIQATLWNTNDTGNHASGNSMWRCTGRGFTIYGSNNSQINSTTLFGSTTSNMLLGSSNMNDNNDLEFNGGDVYGEASFATQYGIEFVATTTNAASFWGRFNNYNIGTPTTHTVADIVTSITTGFIVNVDAVFNDCTLNSTTQVLNNSLLSSISAIRVQRLNGSATDHRSFFRSGIMRSDATINRSTLSARLTPNSATLKQDFARKYIAVASGNTTTIGVYVRCSAAPDTVYNGNRPRLILKKNPSLGVDNDVVLATATVAANGAWELISGTTPTASAAGAWEVYVDCDGTAGFCNVDDWSVS